MADPYEEIIAGESYVRQSPGRRHEEVRARLESRLQGCLAAMAAARLLVTRSIVQLSPGTLLRPDLAVVASANERLLLAIEVIDPADHRLDTVDKKELYGSAKVPRLWMIDPRYDNVEVYQGSPYGLRLAGILAGSDQLQEPLIPGFGFAIRELFADG